MINLASKNIQPFVWLVILVSCVPYLILTRYNLSAISLWFMPASLNELFHPLSFWRLWTPTFVHYTLLHLLTNLYLWWLFATKIENESRAELIILFLISGAVANLSQWWMTGPDFGGLSGVVYALMSYRLILARFGGRARYSVDLRLVILLLALIPLAAFGLMGQYATYAHLGGLVSGGILAILYVAMKRDGRRVD